MAVHDPLQGDVGGPVASEVAGSNPGRVEFFNKKKSATGMACFEMSYSKVMPVPFGIKLFFFFY